MSGPTGLDGLRVLVTRPAAQSAPLRERLASAGAQVHSLPLLQILPPGDPLAARERLLQARGADFWLFTSANAVRGAARLGAMDGLVPADWPEALFAIGRGTASALAALGRIALAPEGATSEALLLWPELQQVGGLEVLVLTGEGGRGLIADTLAERGALVRVARCYRRERVAHAPDEVLAALAGVHVIVLTGGESLEALVALVPESQRAALYRLTLVVPSSRVVELARHLGFTGALLVPEAVSDAAYLARLLRWRQGLD
ncbi:MAG: uroporphyrinogen-III synthase [Stagnimonas sp.]|nr:uroporphyrinogen-III synthase [Stagnimonas sp.]